MTWQECTHQPRESKFLVKVPPELVLEVKIWHKVLQTRNKTCTKHLFLLTNFARRPSLPFRMHVALSVPIQIETFGG